MSDKINAVILAGGKGTRLKINTPKPLCQCMGHTLVDYVIKNLDEFGQSLNAELNFCFSI